MKDRFNNIKIHGVDLDVSYVTFTTQNRQGCPINAVCCAFSEDEKKTKLMFSLHHLLCFSILKFYMCL